MADKQKTRKEDDIRFFIEDANLFALWFLATPGYYANKDYIGMSDVSPLDRWHHSRVFNFLRKRLEMASVDFPPIGSYNDIPKEDLKLPIDTDEIREHSTENKEKIISASHAFLKDNFGLTEFDLISPHRHDIYNWIYIQPAFSEEELQKLHKQLDEYIEQFLNNELFVYDRNYLTFEKQKQAFIEKIREMGAYEKYGELLMKTMTES